MDKGHMRKKYRSLLFPCLLPWLAFDATAAEVLIDQKKMQFVPTEIVVQVGDTLVFTNRDDTNHNIQIVNADGDAEDKGLQRPGEITKYTVLKQENLQVRCLIHPDMVLEVTVK